MDGRRTALAAGTGALLGALWWGIRELIASGAICSTDDYDCLGTGVIAMPVAAIAGALLAWLVFRALNLPRPAAAAVIGAALTAILMILTIWFPIPAGAIITGALGFAIAAAVTGPRRVSETSARD